MTQRWRTARRDDEGFALVVVMGIMLVLAIISTVLVGMIRTSLRSGSAHGRYEAALATAETGIDQALAQLQQNTAWTQGPAVGAPFSTATAERTWARTTINNLAASTPALIKTVPTAQYLTIRPSDRQTVYSMSWAPSYDAVVNKHIPNGKTRLLKAEFIFSPYAPTNALLTQGDLDFSGSVLVNGTGVDAPVHTNGNVVSNNASLTVNGTVTSSGSYNISSGASVYAGSGGQTPYQTVPVIAPRDFYTSLYSTYTGTVGANGYSGSWYDLCDDGTMRARDNGASGTPCTGTILNKAADGTLLYPYRGWNFAVAGSGNPPTWSMDEQSSPYEGIYYAYGADTVINGQTHNGAPPWHATVLSEPKLNGGSCIKVGGSINWKLTDIANFIPGTVLIAGHNLYDSANNDAGDGLFAAADQVYMQTSSASLKGSIIAGDACPPQGSAGPSTIQGVTLTYDQTAEIPLTGIIRTTLWLEYTN
jgi:hypothetical protein